MAEGILPLTCVRSRAFATDKQRRARCGGGPPMKRSGDGQRSIRCNLWDLIGFGRIFDRHLGARLFHGVAAMAAFVGVRDVTLAGSGGASAAVAAASGGASGEAFSSGEGSGLPYSPAKMKAASRGRTYYSLLLLPRVRKLAKVRILLAAGVVLAILLLARQVGPLMGWNYHSSLSSASSSRFHILLFCSFPCILPQWVLWPWILLLSSVMLSFSIRGRYGRQLELKEKQPFLLV